MWIVKKILVRNLTITTLQFSSVGVMFMKFNYFTKAAKLFCFPDYKPMIELVDLHVMKFITTTSLTTEDGLSKIIDTIFKLMLVILDGLQSSEDSLSISGCSLHWAPIFQLKSSRYEQHCLHKMWHLVYIIFYIFNLNNIFDVFVFSLLNFIREVMEKDTSVLCAFRTNILRYIYIIKNCCWYSIAELGEISNGAAIAFSDHSMNC